MHTTTTAAAGPAAARMNYPSPAAIIVLAISIGLCSGYLDLVFMLLDKGFWNSAGYLRNARDFPWMVPVGHVVLLLVPAVVMAAVNHSPVRRVSLRTAAWLFASLAIWSALLRAPLFAGSSLVLAAGLGRLIGNAFAARGLESRRLRYLGFAIWGLVGVLAALSTGWQTLRERRAVSGLPPALPNARNVVMIVWDTVRAYNISSYGYFRDTTPHLTYWANQGVQYNHAVAPAPWTFPSHSCFFTGEWPLRLNSQWKFKLDTPRPTLAEYLASRGYQTAGFAANTNWCSYESGLSRGFDHYEDYPLSPWSLLSRTVPGKWILENALSFAAHYQLWPGAYYEKKWVPLQSRGGSELNDSFLEWLSRRRTDRPFFAYLNYYDAHEPFVPPPGFQARFGVRPSTAEDYRFLFEYLGVNKRDARKARAFDGPRLLRRLHQLPGPTAREVARDAQGAGAAREHRSGHHLGPRGSFRRSLDFRALV